MQPSFRALAALSAISILCGTQAVNAAIGASGDASKPSQPTSYPRTGGFQITENVALDPAFGPWQKSLVNTGGGVASGTDLPITELLTNIGNQSWSDWHEEVLSRTTINNPNDSPGFLFRQGSLTLAANYGAGFVPLTQGVQYTLVTTPYSGPPDPMGNDGNWEAINILLQPGFEIAPGNTLRIDKGIFEVLLDANPWRPDDAAVIGEFPSAVPEPAALFVSGGLLLACVGRRRRSQSSRSHHRRCICIRRSSRSCSLRLIVSRLSCCCLPRATPSSSFARPSLK